jgi:hypothetical protein
MFLVSSTGTGTNLPDTAQLEAMARLCAPAQQRSTHPVAHLLRRLGRHLGRPASGVWGGGVPLRPPVSAATATVGRRGLAAAAARGEAAPRKQGGR